MLNLTKALLLALSLFIFSCNKAPKQKNIEFAPNGMPIGTDIGYMAPEISLPDGKQAIVKLSSLKGNYVLIDFWASWCPPCRAEIPHLKQLYTTYKDKGLTIYGVSLDKNNERWQQAVNDYQMQWIQVSDLKKWDSPAAVDYGVTGIPMNFLVDKDGKIIAKNLHGIQLEEFLKKLFN